MSILSNDIVIAAPADTVWRVVGARFDRIGEWATAVTGRRRSSLPRGISKADARPLASTHRLSRAT
jgi:hypothetical protein